MIAAPRSGSTLLFDLLALADGAWTPDGEAHGPIEGIPGLHPANRGYASHALSEEDAVSATVTTLQAALCVELRDRDGRPPSVDALRRGGLRLVEKTPENALRVSFLARAFPDARFVFLHREGRQNVSSLVEAWHHGGFVNLPMLPGWERGPWCFSLIEGWREHGDDASCDLAAWQWAESNRRALDALELLDDDRWIALDYEELVNVPRAAIQRICAFAELETSAALDAALSRPLPVSATSIGAPSPIKWKRNARFREDSLRPHRLIAGRLRELGGRSAPPPPPTPAPGRVRYQCPLESLSPVDAPDDTPWRVAPSLHLQLGSSVPLAVVRHCRFRERFVDDLPVLWVEDAASGAWLPYFASQSDAYRLRCLVPGALADNLSPTFARRLARAGALVPVWNEQPDATYAMRTASARDDFDAAGWCLLADLLPAAHAQAMVAYLEALIAEGDWPFGDVQVARRYGWHNEPVTRFFHHQFAAIVSRIAGIPVRPSYCYASVYREGASLRPHLDREQCAYTLTLWVARHSVNGQATPWPLWFRTDAGKASAAPSAGDGVLFRGSELPHWREQPPPGGEGATLLFHYVPADFRGSLD
ncbi:hypothetical protein J2X04_001700 [Lysobacter niabensis]|uniref:2OG-Fe(II) oxygenase n=1 Tax=Agrilutibacter niabensis TaxID=380628 RepID=A0ABU1VQ06_9GAMM|nr:hypothetical protein [Lysobacter niabensis]